MSRRLSTPTDLAVFLFAAPLRARVGVPAPRSLAPTRANGLVRVRTRVASTTLVQPAKAGDRPRGVALLFIGGAALLVSALISGNAGTAIMVLGGVVGVIGLWNYVNQ